MISVLVVDDSKFMAKVLQTVLTDIGFDVVGLGSDGDEGVKLFKELSPDVTLLDVTMPNMDGLECLTEIRAHSPEANVIMLSALKDEEIVRKCLEAGAGAFLEKPIRRHCTEDQQRLISAVEKTMGHTV
ncbi:Chemotaxis protein CheY [Rosistilla oblonga]|uniref:Chemotaxis protein CheY n=1 Tax=Rosistilla oblonga TaxID=2527990 RepID=A0A518IYF4_9BACT|nr:response regulator [Rosistilla oblonga]QDV13703.1 Chemotaxis protein CheY [Rosistilla oblonga]QDV58112.1 Chemotaxis protein CheY [Rosistilla oblonga]